METFQTWNERFPRGEGVQHRSSLTPDSVFLFEQVTSPLPSASYFGTWHWYENAEQLRAHLLNVVLPDMASIWLSEGALGLHVMRQTLNETLDDAMEEWGDDVEFFRQRADDLVRADADTNEALALTIEAIARSFTSRFGQTRTWDLALTAFPTAVAAGAFLYDRSPGVVVDDLGDELPESVWLTLCGEAGASDKASDQVLSAFEGADEF